jgi:hypothetical protein
MLVLINLVLKVFVTQQTVIQPPEAYRAFSRMYEMEGKLAKQKRKKVCFTGKYMGCFKYLQFGFMQCPDNDRLRRPKYYWGTTVTNQNMIQEEIKRRLNSVNACYHSAQNLLSSRLLSKNLKIRIFKTIILSMVLYGCETWSLTLKDEHRLRVFENRVLRRVFGPKRNEVMGEWRKLHNEELRDLYSSPSIIRMIKPRRMR